MFAFGDVCFQNWTVESLKIIKIYHLYQPACEYKWTQILLWKKKIHLSLLLTLNLLVVVICDMLIDFDDKSQAVKIKFQPNNWNGLKWNLFEKIKRQNYSPELSFILWNWKKGMGWENNE